MSAAVATDTDAARPDERTVRRTVARASRPRRWVPAVIVAVLLAFVSLVVAIEVISRLLGQPVGLLPVDGLAQLGAETQWSHALTFVVAGLAAAAGLLLLALAIVPGRVRHRPLTSARHQVVMAVSTDGLRRLAAQAAEEVSGVDRATARAGNGRLAVRVDSPLHDPGNLDEEVWEAVSDRIAQLDLQRPPAVRVHVRHRRD